MRISFQTQYRNSLVDIQHAAEDLVKYQRQVSSGLRVQSPSDDPTAAQAAVIDQAEVDTVDQYKQSADTATSRLSVIDTVLSDIIDKLTQAQSVVTGALGTTATPQQRQAASLEMAGIRDALLSDFNSTFRGTYLFSGTNTTVPAYTQNADGTINAYQGSTGTQSLDVNRQKTVQVTYDGDVIARGSDATDLFTVVQNLVADVVSGNQASLQAGMDALKRAFDRATQAQSRVGTDEKALENEQTRLSSMSRAAAARLAADVKADMAGAISGLQAADTAHKAALGAASTISQLSLLDYLK